MIRHACARCGRKQPVERMVYSRFTHSRYCADITACRARAAKVKRAEVQHA